MGAFAYAKFQRIDGVQLVGVVDRAIECARGRAEEFALSQYAGSLDTLRGEFDVVSIAVPIPELADVALCAVEMARMFHRKTGRTGYAKPRKAPSRRQPRGEGRRRVLGTIQSGDSFRAVCRRMVACRSAPRWVVTFRLHTTWPCMTSTLHFALWVMWRSDPLCTGRFGFFSLRLLGDQGREARVRVRPMQAANGDESGWMENASCSAASSMPLEHNSIPSFSG